MEEKEIFYRAYNRFCIKHSLPIEKVEAFGRLLLPDGFRDPLYFLICEFRGYNFDPNQRCNLSSDFIISHQKPSTTIFLSVLRKKF
jgi:hypothetical protein